MEALREIAEQDRTSRETAWLRAEQAESQVEELKQQLARTEAKADSCFDAFESQKAFAAELSKELKQEQTARQNAESETRELRDELEDEFQARMAENIELVESPCCSCKEGGDISQLSTGLTFPYATKELEAMRSVALEHWAGHTPDKRQHKQDAIQRAICKVLGLDVPATKTPPNKAIYLAMAIKPEGLPKA